MSSGQSPVSQSTDQCPGTSKPRFGASLFRRSVSLVSVLLLPLLVAASCERADAQEDPKSDTVKAAGSERAAEVHLRGLRVEVAILSPSSENLQLEVPGEVEGYRDAWLAAPLGGYIEKVLVKKGARVREGRSLLYVDRQTHALREQRVRLQLEVAAREHQRAVALGTAIPTAEVDSAKDRVQLAEANLRELVHNSQMATVRAPFSGVVVDMNAEVGEVAPPGTPLLRLVQLDPILVTVALSDRDISLAEVGSVAHIQLDARSGIFEGKVTAISQAANLKTRAFEATIQLPNPDGKLLPGMIASVSLMSKATSGDKRLVIAQDWLVTRRNGVGVFVEEQGKARWRSVKLGEILRRQVVVESGLKTGDALIIVGHRDLVEGDDVLVHRRGQCCLNGRATFATQAEK